MPLIQRQLELKTIYHFSCECEACTDDWIVQDNDSTEVNICIYSSIIF